MDSCHLFNFLFGTKRATSELGRCLSTLADQRRSPSKRSRSSSRATDRMSASTPPPSPLKQLQAKIASLSLTTTRSAKQQQQQHQTSQPPRQEKQEQEQQVDRKRSISCDARSGTYRATLVAAIADDDNEAEDNKHDDDDQVLTVQQTAQREVGVASGGHCESDDNSARGSRPEQARTAPTGQAEPKDRVEQPGDCSSAGNEQIREGSKASTLAPKAKLKRKRLVLYDESSDPIVPLRGGRQQSNQATADDDPLFQSASGGDTLTPARLAGLVSQQRLVFESQQSAAARTDYANDADQLLEAGCRDLEHSQALRQQRRPSRVREKRQTSTNGNGEEDKCLSRNSTRETQAAERPQGEDTRRASCESARDKRSVYVRSLVQSIESSGSQRQSGSRCSGESKSSESDSHKPKRRQSGSGVGGGGATTTTTTATGTRLLSGGKPVTFVKPLPPKTPPKSNKAKSLNLQLILANKPGKIEQLFQDERFLTRLFDKLEPLDRCVAAQVCRQWRNILYANRNYWKNLVNVIDCSQLRREHLVECIMSTLQSAKLKQLQHQRGANPAKDAADCLDATTMMTASTATGSAAGFQLATPPNLVAAAAGGLRCDRQPQHLAQAEARLAQNQLQPIQPAGTIELFATDRHLSNIANGNSIVNSSQRTSFFDFDQADVWRIQELCNRFTQRATSAHRSQQQQTADSEQQQQQQTRLNGSSNQSNLPGAGGGQVEQQQQQQQQQCTKSASIPSQISSTISSLSLCSLLSPLSESSRIVSIKEKLYTSLDNRGFDAICLFGATDDDIEDLVCKIPVSAHKRIIAGRLSNSCLSNRGIDLFVATFGQIRELELTGCCELTNALNLKPLKQLKRLTIIDCIKIGDGYAEQLAEILGQLEEFTMLAYHCSDLFLNCLISMKPDASYLKRLELQNCREITNQTLIMIAKHFPQLRALSLSGSSQITDDGVEIFAERARQLRSLDLSWCARITDSSLECIACDLGDSLSELILDRNVNITDIGLGYLATMSRLKLLHIRWCPRITDIGLESVIAIRSLEYLSLAGIHQITARSLLALPEASLSEVELTNCPAVNTDLILFLSARMPKCNIIF